ncbi:AAA family ATPase [Anabaena sphaerica FACHB-251]|uniref:AAA family ATPase n=1 Tax=Anabaena sphaerica FACHB-251 TaxID=2692883 RepID=A0A927A3G2_9NOST|nr:AAA family ATPase [Anabaena sphaerica]MBD2296689.1 AAA family ATPase [Anabaena sphaerica FACHB-251]
MSSNYASKIKNILQAITPVSNESDVEQKVIIPLLLLLGYSNEDWQSQVVILQSKLDFMVGTPDLALIKPAYLIIEVKAPNKKIAHSVWQINNYMRQTGAILGLLTNGYDFRLLCNYGQKIITIVEFSQTTLIQKYHLFHKILAKKTYVNFSLILYKNQQNIKINFLNLISQTLEQQDMLNLFNNPKSATSDFKEIHEENINTVNIREEQKAMIITVFNNKGGVGKTTTTINLAAALNKLGKRVLLIDIDAQANLTMGLGIDPLEDVEQQGKKDITHLLIEPKTKLEDTIIKTFWGDVQLDLVPSHIRLSGMEPTLHQTVDSDRLLAKKLKKHDYDYVLIDPPPSFGKVNSISLMASSAILIPTQLSAYAIRALEYVLDRTNKVEQLKDEPLPILGIAVSMYDQKSSNYNKSMVKRLFEILEKSGGSSKVELFPEDTWIPRLNIVSICQDKGYPLYQSEFDNKLTYQEKEAAQKVVERYINLAQYLTQVTTRN